MVSVLHLRFVDKIGMLRPFKPTQHQLYGYGGKSLKVKGKVRQTCTYNASAKDLEFYVVDTTQPLVLSLQSYLDLKLINLELSVDLLPDPIQKLPKTLSYILKENADVFTDIDLVCGEYQITLSPEVRPMVHPPWKCHSTEGLSQVRARPHGIDMSHHQSERTYWLGKLIGCSGEIKQETLYLSPPT